ncbi:MAG TPA: PAS domain-containing protein, partial [Candidatus Aquilonibacter sp.]|nr:PAS domain-containing protein [Candidatus Aquilonibacter sp.]
MLGSQPGAADGLEYRRLAETIPALIWLTNAQGRTLYANRRWFDLTGVDITGLEAGKINELIHPSERERVAEAFERSSDGSGAIEVEYRIRSRDGSYRWLFANAVPLRDDDGNVVQWLGAAIDIQEQKNAAEFTQRIMSAVPQIVFVSDADGAIEYYNRRWYELTGQTPDEAGGFGWTPAIHPDDVDLLGDLWQRAKATASPFIAEYRIRRASDGTYRWHMATSHPISGDDGRIVRWIGVATDIDDQKRRESVLRFLADASELMAESFDVERRLQIVADRAVPEFADWCGIYLLKKREMLPVAIAHRDPEQVRLAHQLLREYPVDVTDAVIEQMLAGRSSFMPVIPESALHKAARDERHFEIMRKLEMRSSIQVPLSINGQAFGFVHFVNGPSGRIYDHADLKTGEIIARRISVAIDNARIYERERRVANTFQQAALPRTLPELPGVSLSAFYQPAETEAEIGGDWYDAFMLDQRRLALSIGDVSGKGLDAAVLMSTVRQSIRVAALEGFDLTRIVAAADHALQMEYAGHVVSALVMIVDIESLRCAYVSAGHVPALVRLRDGDVRELGVRNVPLGVVAERDDLVGEEVLDRHSLLVLYTDGLIEANRDVIEGTRALAGVVASDAMAHTPNPSRLLFEALLGGSARD